RDHEIEMIAVNDEIPPSVSCRVDGVLDDLDAAEMHAVIVAQKLVVIAGNVDDAHALARLAQELLHHALVRLRPIPARAQLPPVADVADEIDRIGVVVAQEVEQPIGLAAFGSEMHVEQRAKRSYTSRGHDIAILLRITTRERLTALCCATMTPATLRVT